MKNLIIKIAERDNIIMIQVVHNNRFDINNVTIFLVLTTGQNGT